MSSDAPRARPEREDVLEVAYTHNVGRLAWDKAPVGEAIEARSDR
jgi:hypothetical protein